MTTFTGVGPALDLDGPLPVEREHCLLSCLRALQRVDASEGDEPLGMVIEDNSRVFNGVNVWGYPIDTPSLWEPCSSGTFRDKESDSDWDQPRFDGLVAYLPITCSTITTQPEVFAERAERALNAKLSFAVEQALAKGVTGSTNPFLGDTNLTQLGGGAVLPDTGLAFLENAIAATGSGGLIWMTPAVIGKLGYNLIRSVDPDGQDDSGDEYLATANGTPVISAAGAINTDPAGKTGSDPATGVEWAFATGPVHVYLGSMPDVTVSEYVDRETNEVIYRAERAILPLWDTSLQSGVLIDWTP